VALKIRLRRMGAKKRPTYRIVAIDSRKAREGRFVELLGWYNPIEKPAKVKVHEEKVYKYLDAGAQSSETVGSIFKNVGLLRKYQMMKKGEDVSDIKLADTIKERKKKKKKKKTAKAEKAE
jgi:small subunit ribosomal protein S16